MVDTILHSLVLATVIDDERLVTTAAVMTHCWQGEGRRREERKGRREERGERRGRREEGGGEKKWKEGGEKEGGKEKGKERGRVVGRKRRERHKFLGLRTPHMVGGKTDHWIQQAGCLAVTGLLCLWMPHRPL